MTMPTQPHPTPANDDEDGLLSQRVWLIEKQWRQALLCFTIAELLATFPEARTVIPVKIAAWQAARAYLTRAIQQKLTLIQRMSGPENRWFWRAWVQCTDGPCLRQIARHLARLQRLHAVATGTTRTGRITDEHIQQARAVPMTSLVATPLRLSGKTLCGRCPLQDDRQPSFHVYPATNSWYCFGCHRGGDAITFVRHLDGHSFVEAVHDLITRYA
jgi:hypothetical protein